MNENDRLVSRRVSPVVPSGRCHNIRHVTSGEDDSGIRSPSSSKPDAPGSPDDAIYE